MDNLPELDFDDEPVKAHHEALVTLAEEEHDEVDSTEEADSSFDEKEFMNNVIRLVI